MKGRRGSRGSFFSANSKGEPADDLERRMRPAWKFFSSQGLRTLSSLSEKAAIRHLVPKLQGNPMQIIINGSPTSKTLQVDVWLDFPDNAVAGPKGHLNLASEEEHLSVNHPCCRQSPFSPAAADDRGTFNHTILTNTTAAYHAYGNTTSFNQPSQPVKDRAHFHRSRASRKVSLAPIAAG